MEKKHILYAAALVLGTGMFGETTFGSDPIAANQSDTSKNRQKSVPLQKINHRHEDWENQLIHGNEFNRIYLLLSDLYKVMSCAGIYYELFQPLRNRVRDYLNTLRKDEFNSNDKYRREIEGFYYSIVGNYSNGSSFYKKIEHISELPENSRDTIIKRLNDAVSELRIVNDESKSEEEKTKELIRILFGSHEYATNGYIANVVAHIQKEQPRNEDNFLVTKTRKFLNCVDNLLNDNITLTDMLDIQSTITAADQYELQSILNLVVYGSISYEHARCAACSEYNRLFAEAAKQEEANGNSEAFLKKLNEINERHKCKIDHFASAEQLRKINNNVLKTFFETLDEIKKTRDSVDFIDVPAIQSASEEIVSLLMWKFDSRKRNDIEMSRSVWKIGSMLGVGTGTLVYWDNMPKSLEKRVVLSCAHIWITGNTGCLKNADCGCLHSVIPHFTSSKGDVVFHEKPVKREKNSELSISTYNGLYFGLKELKIKYCFYSITQDLAIYILEAPAPNDINQVPLSAASLTPSQMNAPNFYSIGYGSEVLKYGFKHASKPFSIYTKEDKRTHNKVYETKPTAGHPGDSGSPILYRDPDTNELSVIGVITGYEFPYLDESNMSWITKAGEMYAKMEQEEEPNSI